MYNGSNALDILEGKAPYGISSTERINKAVLRRHRPVICKPNPIKIALKYQQLYIQTHSMPVVAQQFGISRVRVHQMLNLFKLDQRIIDRLLNDSMDFKKDVFWTERKLRKLTALPREKQYGQFQKILFGCSIL